MPKRGPDCEKLMPAYHVGDWLKRLNCHPAKTKAKKTGESWQVRCGRDGVDIPHATTLKLGFSFAYSSGLLFLMWVRFGCPFGCSDSMTSTVDLNRISHQLWTLTYAKFEPRALNYHFSDRLRAVLAVMSLWIICQLDERSFGFYCFSRSSVFSQTYIYLSICRWISFCPPAAGKFIIFATCQFVTHLAWQPMF